MNEDPGLLNGHVVYFNNHLAFGYIIDENINPVFFHLNSFATKLYRTTVFNQRVCYKQYGNNDGPYHRKYSVIEGSMSLEEVDSSCFKAYSNKDCLSKDDLATIFHSEYKQVVFQGIEFNFDLDFTNETLEDKLIFFVDCTFHENVLFLQCKFDRSVFFLDCKFHRNFSFKGSVIKENLHLESSAFLGYGGASFRGVECENIYFDFGIQGPKDLVWFNELNLSASLIISGSFQNQIQFHGDQDSHSKFSKINEIVIGKEYYNSQSANRTTIEAEISFSNIIVKTIEILNSEIDRIYIDHLEISALEIYNSEVDGLISITNSTFQGKDGCCAIKNCSIGTKIIFKNDHFHGHLNLDGTIADKLVLLENCDFSENGSISVYSLLTDKFRIYPTSLLFNKNRYIFRCPKFLLLKREKEFKKRTRNSPEERLKLTDEYISLKNWFRDAGLIDFEDIAYFNQRSKKRMNIFHKLFFKNIFGWGVRLWNLLWSSLIIILLFSITFILITDLNISHSILLSFQSFTGGIFGSWLNLCPQTDNPMSSISLVVVVERTLGVIFVTVFIGAYMRKILR